MHLLFRDRVGVDEDGEAVDLALDPAAVVFGSFSDADLAGAAGADGVRTVPLRCLRHPMSVDLFVERTIPGSGAVVLRLLGGLDWWRYGLDEVVAGCRAAAVPLALLAGDGRDDARLEALSTIGAARRATLDRLLRAGGRSNVAAALRVAIGDEAPAIVAPPAAFTVPALDRMGTGAGRAALVLYRSHALADDLAAHRALADALAARGLAVTALAVDSAKSAAGAAFLRAALGPAPDADAPPDVVLSALAFSARDPSGGSPLAAAGGPVLQLLFNGGGRADWARSARGLGPADLAMQAVLPELDGALATHVIAHKETDPDGRRRLLPDADNIELAADRALGWARLRRLGRAERRVAIVLSDYPGVRGHRYGRAHAVGLDSWASLAAMLALLRTAGYALGSAPLPDAAALSRTLGNRDELLRFGRVLVALQPERALAADAAERRTGYHDALAPPSDAYVAFYARLAAEVDVLLHLGTHGTLEWLPGKAAGLGAECWPARLVRTLPVINPFIVTNPGEAAVARRRAGAVAIGHLAPPLKPVALGGAALAVERLLDEYAAADGLDARRTAQLRRSILDRAAEAGLLAEADGRGDAADDADRLGRLDAYLCDAKELRIGDGLHVFGEMAGVDAAADGCAGDPALADARARSPAAERAALLAALDGHFVPAGPGGAPSPARRDVLPTGRNLAGIDPRSTPTPFAVARARHEAALLLDRHAQTEGEPLRTLVLDLWGSSAIRTGGADLALAFVLMGVEPTHDATTGRCDGFTVVPLAALDRPRVDVTLRISGLFRDAFAPAVALFDQAVRALRARDEAPEDNPLAAAAPGVRVFGPAPGAYGTGLDDWRARTAFGYGATVEGAPADAALGERLRAAQVYLATQDHRGTDLLDGPAPVAHAAGFALAAVDAGGAPALLHLDRTDNDAPRLRTVRDELVRLARFRLANPDWLDGMRRHGAAGAAEMARGVEALAAFARALPRRALDSSFDAVADAMLGEHDNDLFLRSEGAAARAAIVAALDAARARGDWHPRRNRWAA